MAIKTQTFKLGKYKLDLTDTELAVHGFCDIPGDPLSLCVPRVNTMSALATVLHEAAHVEGVPTKYLDKGRDFTEHQAKLAWRMGWRLTTDS